MEKTVRFILLSKTVSVLKNLFNFVGYVLQLNRLIISLKAEVCIGQDKKEDKLSVI